MKKNKQKTRKSISKRFKVTGQGKVIRGHQSARHRRARKSKRRIRHFGQPIVLNTKQTNIIKTVI